MTAKEKTSVTMCCKFSAPPKEVQWFKGQTALNASRKFSMRQKDANAQLTIQTLSGEDSGEYRCRVGVCESKANLKVEGKVIKKAFRVCCFQVANPLYIQPVRVGLLVRAWFRLHQALIL